MHRCCFVNYGFHSRCGWMGWITYWKIRPAIRSVRCRGAYGICPTLVSKTIVSSPALCNPAAAWSEQCDCIYSNSNCAPNRGEDLWRFGPNPNSQSATSLWQLVNNDVRPTRRLAHMSIEYVFHIWCRRPYQGEANTLPWRANTEPWRANTTLPAFASAHCPVELGTFGGYFLLSFDGILRACAF